MPPTLSHEDIAARATVSVEEAARYLGCGRTSAYEAVRSGEWPTVAVGRRRLVPTAWLLKVTGRAA